MNNRSQKSYDSCLKRIIDSQKPYFCNADRIFKFRGLELSLLYKLQMNLASTWTLHGLNFWSGNAS